MYWRMDGGMCKGFGITIFDFSRLFVFSGAPEGCRRFDFFLLRMRNEDFAIILVSCSTLYSVFTKTWELLPL